MSKQIKIGMATRRKIILKVIVIFFLLLKMETLLSQNLGFTYQAVAIDQSKAQGFGVDTGGEVLANMEVAVKFSIREGDTDGVVRYEEIHETKTDLFGIFRLIIGRGLNDTGSKLESLNWGNVSYYLQIEIDFGDGFVLMGSEELLGSPYALNSVKQSLNLDDNLLSLSASNSVVLSDNDSTNELVSSLEIENDELRLTDAGGTKSVNLTSFFSQVESSTDELQDLILEGNVLRLTESPNGNLIDLSTFLDDTHLSEQEVDSFVGNNGYLTVEIDGSVDNELQTLSRIGTDVTLSNEGGTISIADNDDDATNEIQDLTFNSATDVLTITGNATATEIDLSQYSEDAIFASTSNVTSNQHGDYASDDFVFGSPFLNNDGNSAYENRFFFDKSLGAFRAGQGIAFIWDDTFLGEYSIGLGQNVFASGIGSVALGVSTGATGNYAFASGFGSTASSEAGSAMGFNSTASGNYSIAMGQSSSASGIASAAIGQQVTAAGEGAVAMGSSAEASGLHAIALGFSSEATAENSMSIGTNTTVSGLRASALGYYSTATGTEGFAIGSYSNAPAFRSMSFGFGNFPYGEGSVAIGYGASTRAAREIAIGTYNTDYVPVSTQMSEPFVDTDRLFTIGNGANVSNPSDALIILRNGNTEINGRLTLDADNDDTGYTLPGTGGTNGQILTSDGTGGTDWANPASQIQDLNLNAATDILTITGNTAATAIDLSTYQTVFATTGNVTSNENGDYTTDDFVFGSPSTERTTSANRSRMFFDKSDASFRAGIATTTQWNEINRGLFSIGLGHNTIASARNSVSVGSGTIASGSASVAIGLSTEARSSGEVVLGRQNTRYTPLGPNPGDNILTDRLFTIGNGIGSRDVDRSDALVMLKNGNTTLNGTLTIDADNVNGPGEPYTFPGQDGVAGQVMSTDGNGELTWVPATDVVSSGAFSEESGIISNNDLNAQAFIFGSSDRSGTIMYFDRSRRAFRAGRSPGTLWSDPAGVGLYSVAFGYNPIASGDFSFTAGNLTRAEGDYSVAIGQQSYSRGRHSVSLGFDLRNNAFGAVALGLFNEEYVELSRINYLSSDRLFTIGNGSSSFNRSDALVILKNGNTEINGRLTLDADNDDTGYTLPGTGGTNGQILTSDGTGGTDWTSPANQIQDLDLSTNTLTITGNPSATNIDLSPYENVFETTANVTSNENGDYATDDFVFGSPSLEDDIDVTHDNRMLFDKSRGAFRAGAAENNEWDDSNRGNYSVAVGIGNNASSFGETVIGTYATQVGGNQSTYQFGDRLFVVGDGSNDVIRNDALVIYKGNVMEINRELTVNGSMFTGDITAISVTGQIFDTSDRRLKTNIQSLEGSSQRLNMLEGYNFSWKGIKHSDTTSIQTGFIAQELEQLFPELVVEGEDGYKKVNYLGLIPHIVEALKELQKENAGLRKDYSTLKEKYLTELQTLENRLKKIEALLPVLDN